MQCVYICSMNYIYFAHSKHIFNEMQSFLTPLKTFLPPPNVWTHHDTHSKKKVSEVTGRESVNWNDDGEECERLCEPDSAGVCLYVWWALIILSDRLASLLLSDLILGHFSCGAFCSSSACLFVYATVCLHNQHCLSSWGGYSELFWKNLIKL